MNQKRILSFVMLAVYTIAVLCSSLLNVSVFAAGLPDAKAELHVSLSKGGTDVGDTFNEKITTPGNLNITVTVSDADFNGGRIEISDFSAPVTISTSLSSNPYILNSGITGKVFYINLKPMAAGTYATFSLPFTSGYLNKNQTKYIKNDININLKGQLTDGSNTKPAEDNKQVHFDYSLDPVNFAPIKSVQQIKTNLSNTKLILNYRMQLNNSNYQTAQSLQSLTLTDEIPDLAGSAPLSAKITGVSNLSNVSYTGNFNTSTKTFTMELSPLLTDRGFQMTTSAIIIYFDVEYDMPDSTLLNSNTPGNLTNTIQYQANGYDHPDHVITKTSGEATSNYPLKNITGSPFEHFTYTEKITDVPSSLISGKFSGYSYYYFNAPDTLNEIKNMEVSFTGLYYSSKPNSSVYKNISNNKVVLTKFTVSGLQTGTTMGVYDLLGNKLGDMTNTAPFTVPPGYNMTDLKFIPSKPASGFYIYMYYDLNDAFIAGLTSSEKTSDLTYLKGEGHLSITDQTGNTAVDQITTKNTPTQFVYSMMSHILADLDTIPLYDGFITKSYNIEFPGGNNPLNVTNPCFYVVFPKEAVISGVNKNEAKAGNVYDDFDISYYKLSDGSTAIRLKGNQYYPTDPAHYNLSFNVDIKSAPAAINGSYAIKSYSFTDEKVYLSSTTVNKDYLNGLSTTNNGYSYYSGATLKIARVEGASLSNYTSIDGSDYFFPQLAPADNGETYQYKVPFFNNSSKKITDVRVFVRLPFAGNTDFDGKPLNSAAKTYLTGPLTLPDPIKNAGGRVYYTESQTPGEDITLDGWTQTPVNYTNIQNICIDFGGYVISTYEYIDFMSLHMAVSNDSPKASAAVGTVKMKANPEGIGNLEIFSGLAGVYVPDYTIQVENYVTDRLGNILPANEVPNDPSFHYTLTNTVTNQTYEIELKANGTLDVNDLPRGTYTITRPHMPNIEDPTFGETAGTVTLTKTNQTEKIQIYNMLYKPYPEIEATIYESAEINLNSQIPGSNGAGVTFEVNDKNIATVSAGGTVTGISEGMATVIVKNTQGDIIGIEKITVIPPVTVSDTVYIGEEINLNDEIPGSGELEVTFVSTNPDIASVDSDGTITGVSAGDTVITVRNSDHVIIGYINIKVLQLPPTQTAAPTEEPTVTAEITPVITPTGEPTVTEDATTAVIPTQEPTVTAKITPVITPTGEPTVTEDATTPVIPTEEPTVTDEITPIITPTAEPTAEDTSAVTSTTTPETSPTEAPITTEDLTSGVGSNGDSTPTPEISPVHSPTAETTAAIPSIRPTVTGKVLTTHKLYTSVPEIDTSDTNNISSIFIYVFLSVLSGALILMIIVISKRSYHSSN